MLQLIHLFNLRSYLWVTFKDCTDFRTLNYTKSVMELGQIYKYTTVTENSSRRYQNLDVFKNLHLS